MRRMSASHPIFILVSPHVSLHHFQELATERPYGRRQKGEAASTNTTIMTVSHIVQGLAGDLRGGHCQKTSCQVWNSESAQRQGGVFADCPLVHPETPTPSLWCLCVFVNEEILVPWWDIALSWADSASSVPSAPAQSHSCPTHPQSHQASGFTSLPVNGTTGSCAIKVIHNLLYKPCISYPENFQCIDYISGTNWWLTGYFLLLLWLLDVGGCEA